MATTEIEICNNALLEVGVTALISALDEPTVEAEACNAAYPVCRNTVLGLVPWPFAQRRAQLSRLDTGGLNLGGFAYAYALPMDYVGHPRLVGPYREMMPSERSAFRVEASSVGPGLQLVTDESAPILEYTARIEDPTVFSGQFAEVLTWRLASRLAIALKAKERMAARAEQQFELALTRAEKAAAQEQRRDGPPQSRYISGRW